MKMHVVCFQVPFPPVYGGVIDVFYKLKSLKEAGVSIILHTYQYNIDEAPELLKVVDRIYYYRRDTGWLSFLTFLPYTVYSRRNKQLIKNLISDTGPILFEGLHTCFFLKEEKLRNRKKILRMHNIEHLYYRQLGQSSVSLFKKWYYYLEAFKLKMFEPNVSYADVILAITPDEYEYFNSKYPQVKSIHLPCFYDDSRSVNDDSPTGNYILYHADLSVDSNIRTALFIIDEIIPLLPNHFNFVLAGKNPHKTLHKRAESSVSLKIVANPSSVEMDKLIAGAQINLMLCFQNSGIKLKLLYALVKGHGHCIANSVILQGTVLRQFCHKADTPEEIAGSIESLLLVKNTSGEYDSRRKQIMQLYSNKENARLISTLLH